MNYDKKVQNRLKRIEGQLRGILNMMEEEKDCHEVITQLSAVRSGIDRTIGVIVSENLVKCVQEAQMNGEDIQSSVEDAVKLLVKSR